MQPCGCHLWLSDAKILFQVSRLIPYMQKSLCMQLPLSILLWETGYHAVHQLPPKDAQSTASENL